MFRKRPSTSTTLLAWTVVNTRWPVRAELIAICAVSLSRISPTMILSGSCRKIDRNPRANVSPFFSFTGICDPAKLILHRIFDRDNLVFVRLNLVDRCVQRGGFPRTRRPGHQHHPVRLPDIPAESPRLLFGIPDHIQAQFLEFLG